MTPRSRADELQELLTPIRAPWVNKAQARVVRRVADARAHVERGELGSGLLRAEERLDELLDDLAGEQHGTGLIAAARVDFHWKQHSIVWPLVDASIRIEAHHPLARPSAGEAFSMRHIAPEGTDRDVLGPRIEAAKADLDCRASFRDRPDLLALWEIDTAEELCNLVHTMLSDSQMAVVHLLGHSFVREEFHEV
jgi:hypothetical protein